MAIKQREAVYLSTTEVLASKEIQFAPGTTDVRDVVTTEIRKEIADRVVDLFKSGQVEFKGTDSNQAKLNDDKLLRNYVTGLITNWFNKDPLLNGGNKYSPKSPGSRVGNSDPQIKEMKLLRKHLEAKGETEKVAKVDKAIQERIAEIKAISQPVEKEIDVDQLPDFLRDLAV